jgi:hypothetical protein
MWTQTGDQYYGFYRWDGLAAYDIDNDGTPEVLNGAQVLEGSTGRK